MTFEALNTALRWIIVTLLANLVKNVASSMAESPPPTTITSSPLKKAPSQVAQVDMPLPFCPCSPSAPSHIASAPVQIMTVSALNSSPSTHIPNGREEKSTFSTFLSTTLSPNLSACERRSIIISGPPMPWGYPGKFSMSEVSINCPPDMYPANIIGSIMALAEYRPAVYPAGPDPMMMTLCTACDICTSEC